MSTYTNNQKLSTEKFSISYAFDIEQNIRNKFLEDRELYGSLNICIEEYIDKETKTALVDVLNTCTCCDRHQLHRPVKYEPLVDTNLSYTQDTECKCRCRHFSRFICRTCE